MKTLGIFLSFIFCATTAFAEEKTQWTSAAGTAIEATMISQTGDSITLRKPDGKTITVKLNQLSEVDQKWVIAQREENAEAESVQPSYESQLGPWENLALHETFDGPELPESSRIAHGFWVIEDGKLKGTEDPAENHKAVLSIGPKFQNSAIELRFQRSAEDAILEFSYNRGDGTGHMLRVYPLTERLVVAKQKPKRDPNASGALIGKEDADAAPEKWHTLFVEVRGEKVSANLNGKTVIGGSHPGIANPKAPIRLVVGGDHVLFDEIKIWTDNDVVENSKE